MVMAGSSNYSLTNGNADLPPPAKMKKLSNNKGGPFVFRSNILQQRSRLPIFSARNQLILEIKKSLSTVIIGETGSGKTTQIPQFLYEQNIGSSGIIAITQPRRVAAITIANRVALEMTTKIGSLVGYCVRFEDVTSPNTKIKYMTDGMLLREAIFDPLLKKYTIIILDEAHERTVYTDILFGIVKGAQKQRKETNWSQLKILVMSATMDVDRFSQYFNNAPVLYLSGRQHNVEVMYAEEPQTDYLYSALVTAFQIHQEEPPGDILVFLTGQEEIEAMVKTSKELAKNVPSHVPFLIVYPLYAALQSPQQLRVFQAAPEGTRKLILATNIAETSVTIPGIRYVIDTGMVKAKSFNPNSGLDLLKVQRISKAQAWQRAGRSGRNSDGFCYRLYTEDEYMELLENTIPEIQRCSLASVVLQLLALKIPDLLAFDFMDKPSAESILSAMDQLYLLQAVEKQEIVQLTPIGRQMSLFPLEPRLSKIILASKNLQCSEEILTIVSMLSVESVLFFPHNKHELANDIHKKFFAPEGDHLTLLNIWKGYKGANESRQWCYDNFLHNRNLATAMEIRRQLRDICLKSNIPLKSCGMDTTKIRKCLAMGMFTSVAELQRDGDYITVHTHQPVAIHPSSCLFRSKPEYVIYTELIQTSKCYMRNVTTVDSDWLHDVAPSYFKPRKNDSVLN